MVEQFAVNEKVVRSSRTRGAITLAFSIFLCYTLYVSFLNLHDLRYARVRSHKSK